MVAWKNKIFHTHHTGTKVKALPHAGEDVGQKEHLNVAWKQLGII